MAGAVRRLDRAGGRAGGTRAELLEALGTACDVGAWEDLTLASAEVLLFPSVSHEGLSFAHLEADALSGLGLKPLRPSSDAFVLPGERVPPEIEARLMSLASRPAAQVP